MITANQLINDHLLCRNQEVIDGILRTIDDFRLRQAHARIEFLLGSLRANRSMDDALRTCSKIEELIVKLINDPEVPA